jgi:integrase
MQGNRSKHGQGSLERKANRWQGRWRSHGKPVKRSLGLRREVDPKGLTEKQAREAMQRMMVEYRPQIIGEAVPTIREVGLLVLHKLEAEGAKESYVCNVESFHRNYLMPEFGDRPVDEPKVKDIERFKLALLSKGKAISTTLGILSAASGIFNYARREEWRADNPVSLIDKPKPDHDDEIHYLSILEFETLVRSILDDEIGAVERVMYRTAAMAGLRRGELLALLWRHIDFVNSLIRVVKADEGGKAGSTKSRRGRWVPMAPSLAKVLEEWSRVTKFASPDDLVFANPRTGRALDGSNTSKRFKKAVLAAGIGKVEMREYTRRGKSYAEPFALFKFHDLRHTFATQAAMNPKNSLADIQKWMGHSSASTTEKYRGFQQSADEAQRIEESFRDFNFDGGASGAQTEQDTKDRPVRVGSEQAQAAPSEADHCAL